MKEIITDITTYKLTDITGLTDEEYDTLISNALAEKAAQKEMVAHAKKRTVEISKEFALDLIGNDEETWCHYSQSNRFEYSNYQYQPKVLVTARTEFATDITKYFLSIA